MRPYRSTFDRSRYSEIYLLRCIHEASVQNCALDLLAAHRIPALAVDAGAARMRGKIGRALKHGGVQNPGAYLAGMAGAASAGLPDIVGVLPGGRALFVECKAPEWLTKSQKTGRLIQDRAPGLPSLDQLAFLDTMAAAGALVGVIWSPEDLNELLGAA